MKCTNNLLKKIRLLCIMCVAAIFIAGCGEVEPLIDEFDKYSSDYTAGTSAGSFFSNSLCVTDDINFGEESASHSNVAGGAGVFNVDTKEVLYNQNIFAKMYPASTTKILTAYIIIKNCDLNDLVTVSENAAHPGDGSSVCGIKTGDKITVEQLLYGLMLQSGNDAAIALAEYYSGSVDAFAEAMNSEAKALGATKTHFVNPSGYPNEDHYTTIYDMYLVFSSAIKMEKFSSIINTISYDAKYENASGQSVEKTWANTCRYLSGKADVPEGFTVVGGKTGTTNAAGHCLILYSINQNDDRIISIVYRANERNNLYIYMSELLSGFAK